MTVASISVEWNEIPCEFRNSEISDYILRYSLNASNSNFTDIIVSAREYTISGLIPRTGYVIEVSARYTNFEESPPVILVGPFNTLINETARPEGKTQSCCHRGYPAHNYVMSQKLDSIWRECF